METLNAGTGNGHSIMELCELLQEVSGEKLEIDFKPPRGVDIPAVTLDSARARALLDWQARVDLKQGLSDTWQWFARGRT